MRRIVSLLVTALCIIAPAYANARPLQLSDVNTMVRIDDPRLSRDGSKVVFARSVADRKKDEWTSQIVGMRSSGGTPTAITPNDSSIGSPRFSPDGKTIAFVKNDAQKNAQIFTVPFSGGTPTQISHAKTGVEQYAWSPDGTRFAYVAADEEGKGVWSVHDDGYLSTYAPASSHLWIVRADGTGERRLTSGTWSVLEAAPPFVGAASDPSWSPDGRSITFIMQADADDSDSDRTSVAIVDVVNGAVRKLTSRTSYEYQSAYAPDAHTVSYIYPHGPGPISVMNLFTGTHNQSSTFDSDLTNFELLNVGGFIAQTPMGVHSSLVARANTAAPIQKVDTAGLDVGGFSSSPNGALIFVGSATNKPPELYFKKSLSAAPVQLTHLNANLASLQYGKSVEISWRASDGERSDGVLTYPVGYIAGKKYPFVLRIHGGPESSSSSGYNMLRQLFAARGYVVLEPNYRGSDNLGTAHEHGIYRDPGTGPGQDVIAGVRAVERMGIIDPKNETVTGHSYGGYMTGWMITHWHHWRSAVEGDAMLDWKQEYDLSAAGNLAWTRDSLGGSPWTPAAAQLYITGSPASYFDSIVTPTRIISGTADETVPAPESYMLYHALRDRGIPVSFIAFPGMHHGPSKPSHMEAYDRVTLEWVARYSR